mmetsp:Transcript_6050/g.6188  ORF Transcript_6050/g.6188 Transcript_6050/m.6188 type:complete len:148 (-) Transcript_6050:384-827(-)
MRRAVARLARVSREIESRIPSSQSKRMFSQVTINWTNKDGSITATQATIGSNLLSVALESGLDLEGGCKGNCDCSTCHIILEDEVFDSSEEASEEEENSLDDALELAPSSRLACQFCVGKEHDGILVAIPKTFTRLSEIKQANYETH